ncbi:signal peptide peptidase SppA, 67K type [Oceanococcus atlanticus]|uniref:Signal peptide peptidase SppA, 67K type n=1 Tax=Oceanococcus atlanticus TaxID=1317117 RepID=A0A1Y1SH10_9GAMM|nr:signal peptide peptidase SppA [Oceanococcus atlanticus]ORE88479.1 signal peptide peptidase SppA, 67K type [Oceanococcus atlanticus]
MSERKSLFRRFFGALGAIFDFFRRAVFIVFLLISAAMIYFVYSGGPPVKVDDGIALVVVPFGQIVDQDDTDPRTQLADDFLGEDPSYTVLGDLLDAIDSAAQDERIKLLFLKLDTGFYAGQAQLEELAAAVTRFRKTSGKPVYAYAPDMGQQSYFLAAAADEVFIDPLGMVFLQGYENYPLYFKEALDKLGVTVNVFRVGEFKSAVEPFTRESMSPQARENAQGWLDDLWLGWREQVAGARGLSVEDLQRYSDEFAARLAEHQGDTAALAKAAGLVDHVLGLHEIRAMAGELVGMDEEHGSFRQIPHTRYLRAIDRERRHVATQTKPEQPLPEDAGDISLIVVQGQIVPGESSMGFAGGETLRRLIDQARDDEYSKALVLRVDSPGGSVFASEQMRRAIVRYQASGRPVVVSMASVAASGGYWISMNADRILAHATTITGSIGVFGLVPTFENSLDKLGIATDGVGTTNWSGGLSPVRPLSPAARQGLQMVVEKDYRNFISRVAEARELPLETVDSIAQGQVWSGQDALDLGLIDALGDFDVAVEQAAALAGLKDFEVVPVTPPLDIRFQFLQKFSQLRSWMPDPLSQWLGGWMRTVNGVMQRWSDPRGVYADCLCVP